MNSIDIKMHGTTITIKNLYLNNQTIFAVITKFTELQQVKLLQASVETKHNNFSFRELRHGNSKRENNLIILEYIITIVSGRSEEELLFITMDSVSVRIPLDSLFGI